LYGQRLFGQPQRLRPDLLAGAEAFLYLCLQIAEACSRTSQLWDTRPHAL
jgi:hypothetical protein